jgi:putative PEP-CTERM system histidine kinase
VLGYLLSASAYALLLVTGLTLWRRRLAGSGLVAALAAQLGWSLVMAAQGSGTPVPVGVSIAAGYLREIAWALVLLRCLRGSAPDRRSLRIAGHLLPWLLLLVVAELAGSLLPGVQELVTRYVAPHRLWGGFLLSIGGLALVEQVARNTRPAHRWETKYVWLAIGALYAWELCLFAAAMLHGSSIGYFWVARGYVNALLAVLLAAGLGRIPEWKPTAFLSPRILFFGATLIASALYVLFMAIGGYYVQRLGGSWGKLAEILFIAAGALLLAVALISERFRAWSRVMLAKYFFPYRYDYRTEWRKLTRALSESSEVPLYERIARVMAGFLSASRGGLWLRDPEGAYAPVGGDLAPAGAPREAGCADFFDYLLRHEWIYDLDEARDPRGNKLTAVAPPAWMLERRDLWLIVPLICEGTLVGFVAIAHPPAEFNLSWEDIDLLRAAGRQAASFLAFEQAAKRLAEAHQFEAMNRLSAVIMHDLRHLIAQQALVVENAARHRDNPKFFDDAILTIDHSVKRMTRLMDELRAGVLAEETHRVELNDLCAEATRRCAAGAPPPALKSRERSVEVVLNRDRMLQILEHVIRNAQQATPAEGSVTVSVGRAGEQAVVEVADTGSGMDAEFIRHRLFRPFDTTKGHRGFGVGAYQAREFVRHCGGGVEVESAPGRGTRFTIRLPLAPVLGPLGGGSGHELKKNESAGGRG